MSKKRVPAESRDEVKKGGTMEEKINENSCFFCKQEYPAEDLAKVNFSDAGPFPVCQDCSMQLITALANALD